MIHWFNAILLGIALWMTLAYITTMISAFMAKKSYFSLLPLIAIFSWMILVAFWNFI